MEDGHIKVLKGPTVMTHCKACVRTFLFEHKKHERALVFETPTAKSSCLMINSDKCPQSTQPSTRLGIEIRTFLSNPHALQDRMFLVSALQRN